MKYQVVWKSKDIDSIQPLRGGRYWTIYDDEEIAKLDADQLNLEFVDIHHWVMAIEENQLELFSYHSPTPPDVSIGG